jgi:O-antigen/teichoic acid export membrane protein
LEVNTNESHKTILKATGVFGFSQLLKILVGLVGSKFVALFLGTAGIGIVGLLQNTLAIITSITGFGINISGVRMVAISYAENNQQEFSKTILVLKRWSVVTGLLGVLLTIVLAKPLSIWTFGSDNYANWFFLLSINFIFSSLAVNKMVLLQGTRSMKEIAISTVIFAVLITCCTIPIYYFFRMDGIVAVLVLTSVINYFVNWFFARKIKLVRVQISIAETVSRGKEMIQMGFLLSINVIFGHLMSYFLKLYLNYQNASESVLGLYVVASTLLITYVGMVFSAMSTDFYPRLTTAQKDNGKVKEMVNDQIEIALLLITPLILLFYFLAPLVIKILYSKDFIDVVLILKFALLAIIVKAIIWPLAFIILAKGEKKLYFKQELVSDFMNISFTIFFYQLLGLLGIGLAMLLNYIFYGFYVYQVVRNKFQFHFRENTKGIIWKSLILGTAASIIVCLIDYPKSYWILAILCTLSIYFSCVELHRRVNLIQYLLKIKNKFTNT